MDNPVTISECTEALMMYDRANDVVVLAALLLGLVVGIVVMWIIE